MPTYKSIGPFSRRGRAHDATKRGLSAIHRCPAELWEIIFTAACNDGGATGRSLSLVSRYIRAVSESMRYHSLAVYGQNQMAMLSTLLENRSRNAGMEPCIRHLFLTDSTLPRSRWALSSIVEKTRTIRGQRQQLSSLPDSNDHHAAQEALRLRQQVQRLLALCAPTLLSLELRLPDIRPHALSVRLPHLIALSTPGVNTWEFPASLHDGHYFERLQYIHIWRRSGDPSAIARLTGAPECLTHVRFSAPLLDYRLPAFLYQHLGLDADAAAEFLGLLWLQKTFGEERVLSGVLHLTVSPGVCSDENLQLVHRLREIEVRMRAGRGVGTFILLPEPPKSMDTYTLDDALTDWLDFISGGEGCWSSTCE